MTTYTDIANILVDNGIPFDTVDSIGEDAPEIKHIKILECGLPLEEKLLIVRNLLDGEQATVLTDSGQIKIKIRDGTAEYEPSNDRGKP